MKLLVFILFMPVFSIGQIAWSELSHPPIDIDFEEQYFLIDSSLYMEGGLDSMDDPLRSLWQYDMSTGVWYPKNNFDTIHQGGGVSVNNIGYIIPGWSWTGFPKTCWRYDAISDTWSSIGSLPVPTAGGSSFSSEGRLFTCLGWDSVLNLLNTIWEYDFADSQWVQRNPKPGGGGIEAAVTVVDSFGYLIGGRRIDSAGNYYSTNEMWRYNVNQDRWDSMPPIPGLSRTGAITYSFQNFLIAGFGVFQNTLFNVYDSVNTELYKFDFASGQWSPLSYTGTVLPSAVGAYFRYGTKCYLYGGIYDSYGDRDNNLYIFDAAALGAIVDTETTTGIASVALDQGRSLSVYPSPINEESQIHVLADYSGTISFYNTMGQLLYKGTFIAGENVFDCATINATEGAVIYQNTDPSGMVRNGKIVIIK